MKQRNGKPQDRLCKSLLAGSAIVLCGNLPSSHGLGMLLRHKQRPRCLSILPVHAIPSPILGDASACLDSVTTYCSALWENHVCASSAITPPSLLTAITANVAPDDPFAKLGRDGLTFLIITVLVVPLCKYLKVTPVLGFLLAGCVVGPYGLGLVSNSEANVELGDFGILFLLFNEGLALSPDRIQDLSKFTGLGVLQLVGSIALFFGGTLWGGPFILGQLEHMGIPIDDKLLRPILESPVEAFCIAAAGALSSSAFVLPVLKEKQWTDRPEGIASLSILLLQDLAVAPLLVLIPLLAGSGPHSAQELGLLVAKATVGFASVLVAGSYFLRFVFDVVAETRSTETFVGASLLVAIGMGQIATILGLSASTGAFAAGVLLAGNRYRAQIQADIKPFEGILLGIFFMTAGAGLDPQVVIQEWPTLLTGILAFCLTKAVLVFGAGPALGLTDTPGQAARMAVLLAGGGEFALVLFQLAQDLQVLNGPLAKLLRASVILSMSLTPLLGEVGARIGNVLDDRFPHVFFGSLSSTVNRHAIKTPFDLKTNGDLLQLFSEIDTDRSGSIELEELRQALLTLNVPYSKVGDIFSSFDVDGNGSISKEEWREGISKGLLTSIFKTADQGALRQTDVTFAHDAVVICGYGEIGRALMEILTTPTKHNCRLGIENKGTRFTKGQVVAFDLNPSRVTTGVLQDGACVVYGDAGKFELLQAAGISRPRAVFITYASDSRCLEVTARLRQILPKTTPIYVYEGKSRLGQALLDAGATDVVSETTETVLRFGSFLGLLESDQQELRELEMDSDHQGLLPVTDPLWKSQGSGSFAAGWLTENDSVPGLSEEAVQDLADEVGVSRRQLGELNTFFTSIAGDKRDTVPIIELKEMLMRQAAAGPTDGDALERCMELQDEDGLGDLTFAEFARAAYGGECCPDNSDESSPSLD